MDILIPKRIIFMLSVFLILALLTGHALYGELDNDYSIEELMNLPADLSLNFVVTRITRQSGRDNIFHIAIDLSGGSTNRDTFYRLTYFIDGRFISEETISLPYEIKRDYRGLRKGKHLLTFVLVDQQKRIGRATKEIKVR